MSIYSTGEFIRFSRKSLNLSQEELCEGICSVQTLSRIENGRQRPGKEVYKQLMERIGRNTSRAYATVFGEDVHVLEYARAYENAAKKFDYEKADEVLKKLELLVNDSSISMQYMMEARAIMDRRLKRITIQEERAQLIEALKVTIKNPEEKDFSKYPLLDNEVSIICNIANTYSAEGEKEVGIAILESLYKGIRSGYRAQDKKRTLELLILVNLSKMYGELGEHRKAIELTKRGIAISRADKCSGALPQIIGEMEWNMEQLLDKGEEVDFTREECEKILRQAYNMAAALNQMHNAELIKKHYTEYFG